MAKSNRSKRRTAKARKARPVEVNGHLLPPEIVQKYLRALESRQRTNANLPALQQEQYALDDTLSNYRPSRLCKARTRELVERMMGVSFAIGHAGDYNFFSSEGTVRAAGCQLLGHLAEELHLAAYQLRAIRDGIERESETKLQDWLEWDKAFAQREANFLGAPSFAFGHGQAAARRAEVSHG